MFMIIIIYLSKHLYATLRAGFWNVKVNEDEARPMGQDGGHPQGGTLLVNIINRNMCSYRDGLNVYGLLLQKK